MKHGLTEGCLGCRCLGAHGHPEGCCARLEAEIAKTEEGRARLTTAYLRSLPRDEGGGPGAQPDPGSMVDDSMPGLRREVEALGADAVALAEAFSSASWQRAGAFGLTAGVAMDLRLGWDLGQRADQVKAERRLSDERDRICSF